MSERDDTSREIQIDSKRKREFRCGGEASAQNERLQKNIQQNQMLPNNISVPEMQLMKWEPKVQMRERNIGKMGYGPFDVLDMPQDMNGYLAAQVGKHIMAHFVAGGSNVFEVDGILQKVGKNYMVVKDIQNGDLITCDFYCVRFVRIYGNS